MSKKKLYLTIQISREINIFMKKILLLVFVAFAVFFVQHAQAQESDSIIISSESAEVNSATSPAIINYNMAFPGMLPDHPLYKLKILRDRIIAALISDPQKKIDFYLLQTDKGILASAMLAEKKSFELAESTALKAENNYTLLTQQLGRLNKKPDTSFFTKLETAAAKHQEILRKIIKEVPKENKKTFEQVLNFSQRNLQTLKEFKEMKFEE